MNESLYRLILSVDPVLLDTEVFNFEVEEDNSYVSDLSSTTARPTWPPAPGSRSSAATSPSPTAT